MAFTRKRGKAGSSLPRSTEPRRRIAILLPTGELQYTKHGSPRAAVSQAQKLAEVAQLERAQWKVIEELPYSTEELFLVTRNGRSVYTSVVSDVD